MPRDQQRKSRSHARLSERTRQRVPQHGLTASEKVRAKRMRDRGASFNGIAKTIGHPVRDVEIALAPTRSPDPDSPFAVINTDKLTKARFLSHRLPIDRSEHDVLVRLLNRVEVPKPRR